MNIVGEIKGISYKICLAKQLSKIDFKEFDINHSPTACVVQDGKNTFAISKWVSPKRTRSYPYERVYNTLNLSKKITIIPIVKDEGASGDRDFIQWDTASLMSLLDVFVIFAYYHTATKKNNKITAQKFDNKYILTKINEISQYHSSALHWNLNELTTNLHSVIDKTKKAYKKIEHETGVKLHDKSGLDNFKEKIGSDVSKFKQFSRDKAEQAQAREYVTIQPKEKLTTLTKAKITITNYLGGQYFFTVDEIKRTAKMLQLIECKHSENTLLPSRGDIKDGLLKMILYCNLSNTKVDGTTINTIPILELTSKKMKGSIDSNASIIDIRKFKTKNKFSVGQIKLIETLFNEAKSNKFTVRIKQAS